MPSAWPRRLRGPAPAPPRTTRSLVLRRPPRRALRPPPAGGTPRPAPPAVALGAPAASNAPGLSFSPRHAASQGGLTVVQSTGTRTGRCDVELVSVHKP